MPEDSSNIITGNTDFHRYVIVRDLALKRNSIPDIVMVKDAEDRDIVLFLAVELAYIVMWRG